MRLECEGGEPVVRKAPTLKEARAAVRHGEETLRELAEVRKRGGELLPWDEFVDTTRITI